MRTGSVLSLDSLPAQRMTTPRASSAVFLSILFLSLFTLISCSGSDDPSPNGDAELDRDSIAEQEQLETETISDGDNDSFDLEPDVEPDFDLPIDGDLEEDSSNDGDIYPDGDKDDEPELDVEDDVIDTIDDVDQVEESDVNDNETSEDGDWEEDTVDIETDTVQVEARLFIPSYLQPAHIIYNGEEYPVPSSSDPQIDPYTVIEVPKNSQFLLQITTQNSIPSFTPGKTENTNMFYYSGYRREFLSETQVLELGVLPDEAKGLLSTRFSHVPGVYCANGTNISIDAPYEISYAQRDGHYVQTSGINMKNSDVTFVNVQPGPVNVNVWAPDGLLCRLRAGGEYLQNAIIPVTVYAGSATILDMDCIGCSDVDGDG